MTRSLNPVRALRDSLRDIRTAVNAATALTLSARRRRMLEPHLPKDTMLF